MRGNACSLLRSYNYDPERSMTVCPAAVDRTLLQKRLIYSMYHERQPRGVPGMMHDGSSARYESLMRRSG
jgi:hypothetical protein